MYLSSILEVGVSGLSSLGEFIELFAHQPTGAENNRRSKSKHSTQPLFATNEASRSKKIVPIACHELCNSLSFLYPESPFDHNALYTLRT